MQSLVVESDALMRIDLVSAMESLGYTCFEATTVSEAMYILKTRQIAVVLMDLRVSDGSTLVLSDYLEVFQPDTCVIVLTGTGAFPNGETTRIAPCIDFCLRKPVSMSDLSAVVEYSARDYRNA